MNVARDDVAVAQALAFAVDLVVDDGEAVALAQVLGEVDVVAERVGELEHHRIAHAGLGAGIEQRALDDAMRDVRAALDQAIDGALVHAVRIEGNDDARMVVAVEAQSVQRAVGQRAGRRIHRPDGRCSAPWRWRCCRAAAAGCPDSGRSDERCRRPSGRTEPTPRSTNRYHRRHRALRVSSRAVEAGSWVEQRQRQIERRHRHVG